MLAAAQVTDTIATRLTGLALTGTRVYTAHGWPIASESLPAWRVGAQVPEGAGSERVESATLAGTVNEHVLRLPVRGVARAVADLDDALNALVAQAMPALFAAPVPYGLIVDGEVIRGMANEGEAAVGFVEIPLRAVYFTAPNAPETIISA